MNTRPSTTHRPMTLVAALLLALAGLTLLAAPAGAHGGPGALEVLPTEPQADGASVKVTVRLTFAGDGDPAADATVTVVGEREGDAGADFTPVTLTPSGPAGQYAGVVPLPAPGNWTLRVTSVEPPATATTQVSVAGASLTVESSVVHTTSTSEVPTTTAAAPSTGGSDEDGPNLAVRSAIVGGVVGALAAFMVGARRRKAAQSAGATADRPDAD